MSPVRCAYCGTLSEKPVRLRWVLRGAGSRMALVARVPLCVSCRNSWCPPDEVTPADPGEDHARVTVPGPDRRVA